MRLDAEEEEAARGAVEHLLKTLERDAPGKLPAQQAPPVEPKGNQILRPLSAQHCRPLYYMLVYV
jgi:hypothetical protein